MFHHAGQPLRPNLFGLAGNSLGDFTSRRDVIDEAGILTDRHQRVVRIAVFARLRHRGERFGAVLAQSLFASGPMPNEGVAPRA